MNEVDQYIFKHRGAQKEVLLYFHFMLFEEFGLKPKISYGIPMYYGHKWVVYLNADQKEGVELSFTKGHLLKDPLNLLEGKGRKMVKSVKFYKLEEIPELEVKSIIKEAIEIDNKLKNGKNV